MLSQTFKSHIKPNVQHTCVFYEKLCVKQSINMQNIISFDSVRLIKTGHRLYCIYTVSLSISLSFTHLVQRKCIFLIEFTVDDLANDYKSIPLLFNFLMRIRHWTVTILIVHCPWKCYIAFKIFRIVFVWNVFRSIEWNIKHDTNKWMESRCMVHSVCLNMPFVWQ